MTLALLILVSTAGIAVLALAWFVASIDTEAQ